MVPFKLINQILLYVFKQLDEYEFLVLDVKHINYPWRQRT